MINRKYDVIVVGGGPGGSVAAKRCAQNGFRTLLLEKKRLPREKVCTGMIMGVWADNIVEQMEYALRGYKELATGSLTIGTTRSFARHFMPGLLSRFQESFPGVKVYLKGGSSQEVADALVGFKYDLGIIGRLPNLSKLKMTGMNLTCLVIGML